MRSEDERKALSAKRFKAELKRIDEKTENVAKMLRLTPTAITKYKDPRRGVAKGAVYGLADLLKVRASWLYGEDDIRTEEQYIRTTQGRESWEKKKKADMERSYDVIFDHLEYCSVEELNGFKIGGQKIHSIYKITDEDGNAYFLSGSQKSSIIESVKKLLCEYVIQSAKLLEPYNSALSEAYQNLLNEYQDLDTRPSEDILAESIRIKNDPYTTRIEFKEDTNG